MPCDPDMEKGRKAEGGWGREGVRRDGERVTSMLIICLLSDFQIVSLIYLPLFGPLPCHTNIKVTSSFQRAALLEQIPQ